MFDDKKEYDGISVVDADRFDGQRQPQEINCDNAIPKPTATLDVCSESQKHDAERSERPAGGLEAANGVPVANTNEHITLRAVNCANSSSALTTERDTDQNLHQNNDNVTNGTSHYHFEWRRVVTTTTVDNERDSCCRDAHEHITKRNDCSNNNTNWTRESTELSREDEVQKSACSRPSDCNNQRNELLSYSKPQSPPLIITDIEPKCGRCWGGDVVFIYCKNLEQWEAENLLTVRVMFGSLVAQTTFDFERNRFWAVTPSSEQGIVPVSLVWTPPSPARGEVDVVITPAQNRIYFAFLAPYLIPKDQWSSYLTTTAEDCGNRENSVLVSREVLCAAALRQSQRMNNYRPLVDVPNVPDALLNRVMAMEGDIQLLYRSALQSASPLPSSLAPQR